MIQLTRRDVVLAFAGALLAAGCSATGNHPVASRHDSGIHLAPDPAYATAQLTVVFENAWMDPGKCAFQWLRNGQPIGGATTAVLEPTMFSRGDRITAVVSMPDSAGGASRRLTAEVSVANSPPVVRHASMALTTASGETQVQTTVEGGDPDGDRVAYTYRWFKNGAVIDGATAANLPGTAFHRGDQIAVEVVADDGTAQSTPVRSDPLALDNHPPQFTSQPAAPGPKDDTFRYAAVATDPDGDALRFELVDAPAGMTVDAGGNVTWTLPTGANRRGEQAVTLRASDGNGGEATQKFTIPLEPVTASR